MCVAALIRAFSRSIFLITSAIFLSSSAMVVVLGGDLDESNGKMPRRLDLDSDSRGCKRLVAAAGRGLLFERPIVGSPGLTEVPSSLTTKTCNRFVGQMTSE
jgi:hypothetical protein